MSAKRKSKYDIGKAYSAGFCAAMLPGPRLLSESDHWLAGYDDGYAMRRFKNLAMNDYLLRIGEEPMATVRACDTPAELERKST